PDTAKILAKAGAKVPNTVVNLAANAPKDVLLPKLAGKEAVKERQALQPYLEKAKRTYPGAKKRFLAGLPVGYSFFITTVLRDNAGRRENVFVGVRSIKQGVVS